ncbi:MAG: hypothetical protein ABSE82_13920 [Nitrososphaerales archaeon]|jgi:hypothetical protein
MESHRIPECDGAKPVGVHRQILVSLAVCRVHILLVPVLMSGLDRLRTLVLSGYLKNNGLPIKQKKFGTANAAALYGPHIVTTGFR